VPVGSGSSKGHRHTPETRKLSGPADSAAQLRFAADAVLAFARSAQLKPGTLGGRRSAGLDPVESDWRGALGFASEEDTCGLVDGNYFLAS
jgi:hypothetical protein